MRLICCLFKNRCNLMNIKTSIDFAFIKNNFENMLVKQSLFALPNIYTKTCRP